MAWPVNKFDLEKFKNLGDVELAAYMDPRIVDAEFRVLNSDLNYLSSNIEAFDEYHLVYAILLGMRFSAKEFAELVAQRLSCEYDASVRCAAANSLLEMPIGDVSDNVVKIVSRIRSEYQSDQVLQKVWTRIRSASLGSALFFSFFTAARWT